jgi:ribonuclease P/MRP protein subunit POP8
VNEENEKGKGKGKGNMPPIVFIRVPREDASAVVAALSSWIGSDTGAGSGTGGGGGGSVAWRICARANFLGAVVAGSGAELFST